MNTPGATELLIVLVIVLLIFGPKRLPALGRQLGGGLREFKNSLTGSGERDGERGAEREERLTAASPEAERVPMPSAPAAPERREDEVARERNAP